MKSWAFLLLYAWSISAIFPAGSGAQETKVYTLAVVPQAQSVSTATMWAPFLTKLSQEAGVTIRIKVYYASHSQFETDLKNGVPDFAYLDPYQMVMAHKTQKYVPLIRKRDPLVGVLVAHKNTGVNSVQDIKGGVVAFPSPNSFGASLPMRWLLSKKERVPFTPSYVQTDDNVYRHVVLDRAAAGGGIQDTFDSVPEEIKNQLKIIYQTPPLMSHPFAAHRRVPELVRTKVINAFLKLGIDPAGRRLLSDVRIDNPVVADYETEYAPLAKLGLGKPGGAE
jgi:phosphonate transport system substrate-binding protein